jgi:hypothetical protein
LQDSAGISLLAYAGGIGHAKISHLLRLLLETASPGSLGLISCGTVAEQPRKSRWLGDAPSRHQQNTAGQVNDLWVTRLASTVKPIASAMSCALSDSAASALYRCTVYHRLLEALGARKKLRVVQTFGVQVSLKKYQGFGPVDTFPYACIPFLSRISV